MENEIAHLSNQLNEVMKKLYGIFSKDATVFGDLAKVFMDNAHTMNVAGHNKESQDQYNNFMFLLITLGLLDKYDKQLTVCRKIKAKFATDLKGFDMTKVVDEIALA